MRCWAGFAVFAEVWVWRAYGVCFGGVMVGIVPFLRFYDSCGVGII